MPQVRTIEVHHGGHQESLRQEVRENETFADVLALLLDAGKLGPGEAADFFIFGEDADDEVIITGTLSAEIKRIHIHRCKRIEVTVRYVDQSASHHFTPAATIRKLVKW